ncbi:CIC11C00000004176 [Sungouiella intermedia]|uniref:CIC11C00000004176 n=1 Tax=Sungouiella intermedia TaxID=45354 RepID=A0A1L0DNH8_9ASCO|nr:CIC11C00000004176 [[Candida] intermedia]
MIFNLASTLALATLVTAVPFKRYDNVTETSLTSSSEVDTTITVDKFLTITLPYTTLTLDATASDEIASAERVASTASEGTSEDVSFVTIYSTVTVSGSIVTTAVATLTTTSGAVSLPTTTSTITHFVTVTQANGSVTTAAVTEAACTPTTVTVTKTETVEPSSTTQNVSTITETFLSSYPIVATFTLSDFTTTVTSYVEVTSFQTSVSTLQTASSAPQNGTSQSYKRLRRGLFYDF